MPNISKVVVDVAEDTAEKLEDGIEFLIKPEVLLCIFLLILFICTMMYFMKQDDSVESYKIN